MRLKLGLPRVTVSKQDGPATTDAAQTGVEPGFKPGPESAADWHSALRALRDGAKLGLAELVQASGLKQALQALRETWQPPSERAEAITLLVQHVEALSIEQRAELITEIQKSSLGSAGAAAATQVLLATHGKDLTRLKNLIDDGYDLYNLDQLVFELLDGEQRTAVLDHFQKEAVPTGEVKLLSDIDDTLYASVNDPRFVKGEVYPGVRELYLAMMGGPNHAPLHDVVPLTARPAKEAGGSIDHLKKLGFDVPTVLTGGLATYLRRVVAPLHEDQIAYRSMGNRKIHNFERHQQLFPECGYVFFGDNGQGDVHAGRGMLEKNPGRVRAVFIHQIRDRTDSLPDGIHYFRTYVGAAAVALKLGLISKEGAAMVAAAARQQADTVKFKTEAARETYLQQLREDLQALDASM